MLFKCDGGKLWTESMIIVHGESSTSGVTTCGRDVSQFNPKTDKYIPHGKMAQPLSGDRFQPCSSCFDVTEAPTTRKSLDELAMDRAATWRVLGIDPEEAEKNNCWLAPSVSSALNPTRTNAAGAIVVVECANGSHCHRLGAPGGDWEDYVGPYFLDEEGASAAIADLDDPTSWEEWPIPDRTVEQCRAECGPHRMMEYVRRLPLAAKGFRDLYWCAHQNEPVLVWSDKKCRECGSTIEDGDHEFIDHVVKP